MSLRAKFTQNSGLWSVLLSQRPHTELALTASVPILAALGERGDEADGLRREAPRNKAQHLRRGAVGPLCVVHQTDQRQVLCDVGEQGQHGEADQEPIRGVPNSETERNSQSITLWNRQTVESVEERRAQLLQTGKRPPHLGLDAGRSHHLASGGVSREMIEERSLVGPRLASKYERFARTGSRTTYEPVEYPVLGVPATQLSLWPSRRLHNRSTTDGASCSSVLHSRSAEREGISSAPPLRTRLRIGVRQFGSAVGPGGTTAAHQAALPLGARDTRGGRARNGRRGFPPVKSHLHPIGTYGALNGSRSTQAWRGPKRARPRTRVCVCSS